MMRELTWALASSAALLVAPVAAAEAESPATGDDSASEISKQTQNPVADIISIPIRNDISFGLPGGRVQSLFKIQPVLPLRLSGGEPHPPNHFPLL